MLLIMKHLIMPFTFGAIVMATSLALLFLQVRNPVPKFIFLKLTLSANQVNILKPSDKL
jgi:hypothetical protein